MGDSKGTYIGHPYGLGLLLQQPGALEFISVLERPGWSHNAVEPKNLVNTGKIGYSDQTRVNYVMLRMM